MHKTDQERHEEIKKHVTYYARITLFYIFVLYLFILAALVLL